MMISLLWPIPYRTKKTRLIMESIESLKDQSTYYATSKIMDLLSKASVGRFDIHNSANIIQ